MSAFAAAVGAKALAYCATAIVLLAGMLFAGHTIRKGGIDKQRADDAAQKEADNAAAAQARSAVDGMGDAAVDDKLLRYQRQ